MPCGRRRHALIAVCVSAFVLWPSPPAVDTAQAGGRITKKFRKAAKVRRYSPSKLSSGTTVLGRFQRQKGYPSYIEKAKRGGHRYFYVHPRFLPGTTPRAKARIDKINIKEWRANRKFLDRTILRGDRIVLSTPASLAGKGGGFHRELMYLRSKGYRVSRDGMRLLPPAGGVRITHTGRISGKFGEAAKLRAPP